jgi:hypothetical protein
VAGFISRHDEDIMKLTETCNLSLEMFKEHIIQLQFGTSTYEEEYKALPTQVKSAITRTFNSNNEVVPGTKSRRKPPGEGGSEPEDEEDPVPPNTALPRFNPEIEDAQPVSG